MPPLYGTRSRQPRPAPSRPLDMLGSGNRYRVAIATLLVGTALGCGEPITAPLTDAASPAAVRPFSPQLASVTWNERARALVMAQRMAPTTGARAYGLLSLAQYGAALAVDAEASDGVLPDDGFGEGGRSLYEARRGAIAGASAAILTHLVPSARAMLADSVAKDGKSGPGGVHPQFTRGVIIGTEIGDSVAALAARDGFSTPWGGTIPTGTGKWTGTVVAGASHALMRPYVLTSPSQFRSAAPPLYGSAEFLAAQQEIRTISDTANAEQLRIARDRNLAGGTITGLGFFNQLASAYIVERKLDEVAATHILAVMNAAGSDAVIGCWDSKLHYFYIRPSQVDGLIKLPIGLPGHPSYPSGHSCISGAAARVLTAYFPEHTAELEWHVVENGLSRMYAGIHYRFDVSAGQILGRSVGGQALAFDELHGIESRIP